MKLKSLLTLKRVSLSHLDWERIKKRLFQAIMDMTTTSMLITPTQRRKD